MWESRGRKITIPKPTQKFEEDKTQLWYEIVCQETEREVGERRMTADSYIKIPLSDIVFQQENDPKYTAKSTTSGLLKASRGH